MNTFCSELRKGERRPTGLLNAPVVRCLESVLHYCPSPSSSLLGDAGQQATLCTDTHMLIREVQ